MKKMKMVDKFDVSESDINALFDHIDSNRSGSLTFKEFATSLETINVTSHITGMRKAMQLASQTPNDYFEVISGGERYIDAEKLGEFLKSDLLSIKNYEILSIFKHFDESHNKKISLSEFERGLKRPVGLL